MAILFQGVEKHGAAFRLMQQMGWEEGSGLGKDNQGMKEHLRVRNKQDNAGIGIDQKMKAQALWKVNTMEYDNVLKKLKVVVGQVAVESSEDSITKEVKATHSELLRVIKATRPQGRYKKREIGKMVENYSKTDLAAILGGVKGKSESDRIYESNKVMSDKISLVTVEPSDQVSGDASSDSDGEENVAPGPKRVCTAKEEPGFSDLPADWWGNKFGFVRAGRLGASSGAVTTERTAFHEKDQEDLAKLAHQKATKGKQGLGAADKINMGKASFKGQRKILDSEDEDNEDREETSKVEHKEFTTSNGNENDEKTSQTPTKDVVKDMDGVGKTKTSSNWKKVCEHLLSEAPFQTLSLKRLEKRFCSAMLSAYGTEIQLDKEKLQKSSRFAVEGKKVTLLRFK